jgi:hypothetical protein
MAAAALCVFSAAWTFRWWPSVVPAALFALTAASLYYLASRPAIEIHEHWLRIGNEMIPWNDVRRIDRTRWTSPLVLYLSLVDDRRIQLVYPGEAEAVNNLQRFLRRNARESLIDGVPYRQFWGEVQPPSMNKQQRRTAAVLPSPKYRIVRPEEEEEIERMLQRLKTVGNLDSKSSEEN